MTDIRIIGYEARIKRLEAAGTELAIHLGTLNTILWDERYGPKAPCAGCYDAVGAWVVIVPAAAGPVDAAAETADEYVRRKSL